MLLNRNLYALQQMDEEKGKAAIKKWFQDFVALVGAKASRYVDRLYDDGIGSIERLVKKISRHPSYLTKLGFDQDDAEIYKNCD